MISNIKCLVEACKLSKIPYEIAHPTGNILRVDFEKPLYFVNSSTPFNTSSESKLWSDKDYTQTLFQSVIKMSRHQAFFDPYSASHHEYKTVSQYTEIINRIELEFNYPIILKPNRGSEGVNVFEVSNQMDLRKAVETIFSQKNKDYDYILIAQQKINIKKEFRVIVGFNKILLVYEKDFSQAKFTGNLSPLHWEGARAIPITVPAVIDQIDSFITPLLNYQPINFAGLDVAYDVDNQLWLIEINSSPKFDIFVRDNGIEQIAKMYQTLFEMYLKQ
ncbi:MAG: hypothetical protein OHK0017_02920 [Patescibacteria group bacterium]